jgi:DNA mismatch endonuclease (patch repair protein)
MDNLTAAQRHKTMSHIKSKDTSVEILLRKALWHVGIRYRKNLKTLPGKPDIAITKYKIAIFCDGELWHGKNWDKRKKTIKSNRDYWVGKIERNIARDNENERKLKNANWVVIRFWGEDIKKNLDMCVNEIKEIISEVQKGIYEIDCSETEISSAAESTADYEIEK